MRNVHIPDTWELVKITDKKGEINVKILAEWSGSYIYGRNWRLSSGIVTIVSDGDHFIIDNRSGSSYKVDKSRKSLGSLSLDVYKQLENAGKIKEYTVEIISIEQLESELAKSKE